MCVYMGKCGCDDAVRGAVRACVIITPQRAHTRTKVTLVRSRQISLDLV